MGTVSSSDTGAASADAVITVTSNVLQGEEIAVSDASGRYRIAGLPPGAYVMRVEQQGFKPYSREMIELRADSTIRLNVALLPEALQSEEVVVSGRTPTVDVASSSTGMTISSEFIERVPLSSPSSRGGASRSIESVIDVAPMAEGDAFGVSMVGASSPENSYLLDGISVNNPTYGLLGTPLSIEFVDEISVLTGGYMPEYGHSMGGIVNAITKSGTNDLTASTWFNIAPGALSGSPKGVQRVGQTIQTKRKLSLITDLGADVGAPIIYDKLWIYAGFQWARTAYDLERSLHTTSYDADGVPTTSDSAIPNTSESYQAIQNMYQGIAKLTWAADSHNRLDLTLNTVYPVSGGGGDFGINPLTGEPEIGTQNNSYAVPLNGEYGAIAHEYLGDSINSVLKWSSDINDDARLDTWLGWHRERGGRLPSDGSAIGSGNGLAGQSNVWYELNHSLAEFENVSACDADLDPMADPSMYVCPVNDYRTGGPEFINKQILNRAEARTIWTQLFEAGGHHVFKVGVNGEGQFYDHTKGYSGSRSITEFDVDWWLDGAVYGYLTEPGQPVVLDKLHNKSQSTSFGGFVQDSWDIVDEVTLNLGVRYDTQLLYANDQLAMALDNQISPRGGLVYDPTKEGRAKLFANYGRFYEKVPLLMLDRYLTGEPFLFALRECTEPGVAGGDCFDDAALIPIGDPPNNSYIVAGAGTVPVDPDLKAPSADEIVLGGEYEIIEDGRAGLVYTRRWLNETVEDMSRDEANTYFFGNPGSGIASDFPKAERNYDALSLQFTKTFSKHWLANGSYTLSWLRGNYGGLFRAEDLQLDPHQNSDFDLYSLTANRTGDLPGDHRHSIKLFGAYGIDVAESSTLTPGLALRGRSGGPTNYLGGHPLYGADQVYILPRGSGERLPWSYGSDVRLDFTQKFGGVHSISLTFDVFNVFNIQSGIRRDERYTESSVNPVEDGDIDDLTNEDGSAFDPDDPDFGKNPNYGEIVQYQEPRIFRFGVKGTF
ncbi:MAG: TonB-dependent receptor [Myxococcales bacterium]|nr:TonB-dependent receptor [Myxococcales bacterium]